MSPRNRVYIAVSADGFIADEAGGVGWLDPFSAGSADYAAGYAAFLAQVDWIVMGRRTYDQVLTFGPWPYAGKRCWVLTGHPAVPPPGVPTGTLGPAGQYGEVQFSSEPLAALLARLGQQATGDSWLVGGADVIRQALAAGCVDTLELFIIPVLLGQGLRLFPERPPLHPTPRLQLVQHRSYPDGVVALHYSLPRPR